MLISVSPGDYLAEDLILTFQIGETRQCHDITINQDEICEEPAENLFSNLQIVSGVQPITLINDVAEITIDDSTERECSKQANSSMYLNLALSLLIGR